MQASDISDFKSRLRGELIEPADAPYEEARKVFNAMIDRKPRLIARCADVADVIAAVNFGREHKLRVSIRGGGHNAAGLGVCDDGLVIDLSLIKYVRVDPAAREVRVGGGNTWGEVDHAAHAFGLAVPSGIISTTGVGGLTLGGGIGHLTRKYGLTIDNLLAADVVTADGKFVVASAEENPELFWALRGGGGNFGVVTSFLFRAHPVSTVIAGPMFWDLEDAPAIMRWYREFIVNAPAEMNGFFAFLTVPPGPPFPEEIRLRKMCGIVWCYTGSQEQADAILEPLRSFKKPVFEHVGPAPFPALQSTFDPIYPAGLQSYWKADFFKELSDEAIAEHVKYAAKLPTWQSTMHLYPINGAAGKVGNGDTTWAHRDAVWTTIILGCDADPANKDLITNWSREYWEALHPYAAGGAYVNFMMEGEGDTRIRDTYGDNYDRIARAKTKYDPGNFFNVNQNIRPEALAKV